MKKIVPLILLFLLLNGCSRTEAAISVQPPSPATSQITTLPPSVTPSQPTTPLSPSQTPAESAVAPTQKPTPKWHYDLTSDGVYRTDQNTGDVVKINDQDYAVGITITEDWVYYKDNGFLYRIDNENRRELITSEECRQPCLSGGWLYYLNSYGVNRMNLYGGDKEQLIQCECDGMVMTDNYIFYADYYPVESEPGADDMPPPPLGILHRTDLSGKNDVNLGVSANYIRVYESTVYYSNTEDDAFYSLNPETLETAIIDKVRLVEDPYFCDGYLFFMTDTDRCFYRLTLKDGTLTQLIGGWPRCWGILDGYVYVESFNGETEDDIGTFRIKIDGTELEKVV